VLGTHKRGIRSSGKLIKMVDQAHGWRAFIAGRWGG